MLNQESKPLFLLLMFSLSLCQSLSNFGQEFFYQSWVFKTNTFLPKMAQKLICWRATKSIKATVCIKKHRSLSAEEKQDLTPSCSGALLLSLCSLPFHLWCCLPWHIKGVLNFCLPTTSLNECLFSLNWCYPTREISIDTYFKSPTDLLGTRQFCLTVLLKFCPRHLALASGSDSIGNLTLGIVRARLFFWHIFIPCRESLPPFLTRIKW